MPRTLSLAVVKVLHAVASGTAYGFDVIESTELPSGTVYPALGRLERDGYVRSRWEDAAVARREKRPSRRYYRVTADGLRVLNEELARYRAVKPVPAAARAKARA
jgi:DNA-binding PadR family transcriptional regulator